MGRPEWIIKLWGCLNNVWKRTKEVSKKRLKEESYQPKAVQRKWIAKFGSRQKRPLGIPTVRDRVVQTALRNVIEPIFEKDFAEHSYGFRPKRGWSKDFAGQLENEPRLEKSLYFLFFARCIRSGFGGLGGEQFENPST